MKFLLVGSYFTQGALAVITKGLRQGATVTCVAEPENPYDRDAVRVFVARSEIIDCPEVREALGEFALTLETLQDPFPLGHLGAKATTKAAKLALAEGLQFGLAADWHLLADSERNPARLLQHANGTCLVSVAEQTP